MPAGYGGTLIDDTVVGAEPGFSVRLAGASPLRARRILVATGLRDELPDVILFPHTDALGPEQCALADHRAGPA